MTTPVPEELASSSPRADAIRDATAAGLLILGMLYHWNFTDKGTALWYVILPTLTAVGGIAVTFLARSGALGSSWNAGYDRLIRIVSSTPWLLAFAVLFVLDVVKGGGITYVDFAADLGSMPTQSGGIGSGALIGLGGILLAMQPRDRERITDQETAEDRIWFALASVFGVAAVIALLATSAPDLDTGLAVLTMLLVMILVFLLILVAVPVLGLVRRDPGWTNVVIGLSVAMVLTSILSFGSTSGSTVLGLFVTTDGESVHNGYFCMTFLIAAGAAATAPGTRRIIGRLTDRPTLRITASRVLLLLALIEGVAAALFVYAIYQGAQVGASVDVSVYLSLVVVLVIAGVCGAGSVDLLRGPDHHLVGTLGAGVYAGGSILVAIVNAIAGNPGFGTSFWLTPVGIAIAVVALIFGPRGVLAKIQAAIRRFQVTDPSRTLAADDRGTSPTHPGAIKPPAVLPDAVDPAFGSESERGIPDTALLPKVWPMATPDAAVPPASGQSWGTLGASPSQPPPPPPPPLHDPIRAKASNPDTTPAELAALAENHPHVRPEIAVHPQAYPDLLTWLSQLGDPAVDDALSRRAR